MELRTTDLVVLIAYMGSVFGLGCWFARKSSTTQEFMAAGRSLPGWAVGLSIFGTYVSSIGFLGNTGSAYGGNWSAWVFGLSLPIAAIIAVRYFVPMYRNSNEISAYAHLEHRFGPWARIYALVLYLLTQVARIGSILYLVALALAPLTGWDTTTIVLVTGVVVTVYTLLGGIEAVIWTDVVQSVVLVGGAILCALVMLMDMPGGTDQMLQIANDNDKFGLGSFSLSPETFTAPSPSFWIVLMYGVFVNLKNFGIDQNFVQRYVTAKSDAEARKSVWLGTLLFPVVSTLFFFIGTGLYSLYHSETELLDEVKANAAMAELKASGIAEPSDSDIAARVAEMSAGFAAKANEKLSSEAQTVSEEAVATAVANSWDKEVGDKVLPHFIVTKLPAGVAGLLIAAIFAAAMSSMDTSLNSSATLILCDVYQRYLNPATTERQSMRVLYGATFGFGVIGTLVGLVLATNQPKSALDVWWTLEGIFAGGMLGLFLLGVMSRRARNPQAILAGVIGLLIIAWMSLSTNQFWTSTLDSGPFWQDNIQSWGNPLHSYLTIVVGTTSIVLIGMFAGLFATGNTRR